jgi:hypothetical protein
MPAQPLSEEAVSTHVRTQAGTVWAGTREKRAMREKRGTRTCMMVEYRLGGVLFLEQQRVYKEQSWETGPDFDQIRSATILFRYSIKSIQCVGVG